ncbi:MAG: AzlD domain-containing protein [Christensenellales bacterium]|jgi:branched-subunit amino acid transport protein
MNNNTYLWTAVAVMFVFTYLPRVLPLLLVGKRIKSPFLLAFFRYVPYVVLTSLTIPAIFYSTRTVWGATAGFVTALWLAARNKPMIQVALAGALAVLVTESLLQLI